MKNFHKWPKVWAWAGWKEKDGQTLLCLLLTSEAGGRNLISSWENIYRRSRLNLKKLLEAPNPSSQTADRALLQNILHGNQCALQVFTGFLSKGKKEETMLQQALFFLQTQLEGKLTLIVPSIGHNDAKLRSLMKKNRISAEVQGQKLEENVFLQTSAYLAELFLADEPEFHSLLNELCIVQLDLLQAQKQLDPAVYSFFEKNTALIGDGTLALLLKNRFSPALSLRIAQYMQNGGKIQTLLEGLKKPYKEEPILSRLAALASEKDALDQFDWEHPYSGKTQTDIQTAFLKEAAFAAGLEKSFVSGKYETVLTPSYQTQLCRKLYKVQSELQTCFEEWITLYNIEEAESRDGMPCIYLLKSQGFFQGFVIGQESRKILASKISSLILETMHQDPDCVPLLFSNVSRNSQPRYERICQLILEQEDLWFFKIPAEGQETPVKTLLASVLSLKFKKPPVFFSTGEICTDLKRESIQENLLAFVQDLSDGGRMEELLHFWLEADSYYTNHSASVETRMRPGKDQISARMQMAIAGKKLPLCRSAQGRPYFTETVHLSEETLTILSDPSFSLSLTRNLAKAFEKGLKPGTVYYLLRQTSRERDYQLRLRSLILPYLFIRRQRVFLESIFSDPHMQPEEADFFMNPAFSLSKLQLLHEASQTKDWKQIAYAVHSSMSLKKMREAIDVLEDIPACSSQDVWLYGSDASLHPERKKSLQLMAADILAQTDQRTADAMKKIVNEEDRNLALASAAVHHMDKFWNLPKVRALLSSTAGSLP